MRCLLVKPPAPLMVARSFLSFLHLEPLDLAIVAGAVEAPHEVRILDLSLSEAPLPLLDRTLAEYAPELVGFGCYTNQAATVKGLAARVKRQQPGALVVVGGVHATIVPDDLDLPGVVDAVVRGEGAVALREILRTLESGGRLSSSERVLVAGDPGFAGRAKEPPPELPPLAEVPRPRRDLLQPDRYFCVWWGDAGRRLPSLLPPVATLRTSMGCPFRCSFCVVHHLFRGRYLPRDPEDVVDEIAGLAQDHVYFVDDEMFVDARRAERIARLLIERGVRKEYVSWARADSICRDPDLFRLWKRAGLRVLYVGIESMEPAVLEDYGKRCLPETNRRAVEILRQLDIGLHAALMVNPDFGTADFERLEKTVDSLLPAELSFTVFSPSPGTALWERSRGNFVCSEPYRFYDCMHTLLPTRLPLREFYRRFAGLYVLSFRRNPWRARRVRAPLSEIARLVGRGLRCNFALRAIYQDYPRELW
jgi:radical SAM superfamily enzyme YgiQ (UPF0313 family)